MATEGKLVGYVRKSNKGNALKISILKTAIDNAEIVEGKDGTKYISLIMNLSKVRMVIGDEQDVTSVCQLIDSPDERDGEE